MVHYFVGLTREALKSHNAKQDMPTSLMTVSSGINGKTEQPKKPTSLPQTVKAPAPRYNLSHVFEQIRRKQKIFSNACSELST